MVQQLVSLFKQFSKSGTANTAGAIPNETSFPLTTVQELQNLKDKLGDSSVFNGLLCNDVSYLTVLGVRSTTDATRRILGQTIQSSSLGVQNNWHGKRGKLPFGKLLVCSVIQRAVLKTCRTATLTEVDVAMREWFRTASDRYGDKKRRAQKTREMGLK